jgi:hypothetical protein
MQLLKKTHTIRLDRDYDMAWPCIENGRKQNSLKSITYEFGNKKTEK